MSEALMAQLLRHCFIQIPGESTQPMLVPFVKEFNVMVEEVTEYQRELYELAGATTRDGAEKLVNEEKKKLEQKSELYDAEQDIELTPRSMRQPSKAKRNINDDLGHNESMNLDPQNMRSKK